MPSAKSAPVNRILIIRLSALGDVVMSSGLIPAMRALHPEARISWLTQSAAAPLLRHNPDLHQVIVWPREQWLQLWKSRHFGELWRHVMAFRAQLRAQRFDLVLDAQGLLKSALCAWLTGAPRRVGLIPREGGQLLVSERVVPAPVAVPKMGAEYRFLSRYLGASEASFVPDLAIGDAQRATAVAVLREAGVVGRYAVLAPFTTRPQKHWFDDHWVEVAQGLMSCGWTPVILGAPQDQAHAQRIVDGAPCVVNLAGRLRLDESVAAVAGAGLLIGVDTGLTHMGTALKVPTIALFGSTRPYLDAGSPRTRILYDALPCSPCRRHPTCGGAFTCMKQLSAPRVLNQARELVGTA